VSTLQAHRSDDDDPARPSDLALPEPAAFLDLRSRHGPILPGPDRPVKGRRASRSHLDRRGGSMLNRSIHSGELVGAAASPP
jgi:hypothetical protein